MNLHDQGKATPNLITTCLQENMTKHLLSMTNHDYMKKKANAIIDEDIGKE